MNKGWTIPKHFIVPILTVLDDRGGRAHTDDIKKDLFKRVSASFNAKDFEDVEISKFNTEPRWWNTARNAARQMRAADKALLARSAVSRYWELAQSVKVQLENERSTENAAKKRIVDDAAENASESEFVPQGMDRREVVERQIRARRGQRYFREALRIRFGDSCAVTGSRVVAILEAAHISPYRGEADNHPSNGLLLRADVHTLFDLNLIGIEPETLKIHIHKSCEGEYEKQVCTKLTVVGNVRPSLTALKARYELFLRRQDA